MSDLIICLVFGFVAGVGLTWLYITDRPRRPAPRLEYPEMTEQELTLAFGRVTPKDPFYAAVRQLIETAIANARLQANANIDNHARLAGYVSGAQHLEMLRDDMEARRAIATERATRKVIAEQTKG